MSNRDNVKPQALMRYQMEDEQSYSGLSHAVRRIKIDENETWELRLLPYKFGKDQMPYVPLARHWRNSAPITCPKWTPEQWGGHKNDSDYICPVCDVADRLRQSSSQDIKDLSYRIECKVTRRFVCLVYAITDRRDRKQEMSIDEILNPYEFEMTKNAWKDYLTAQKLTFDRQRTPTEFGCLDLEFGCNFLATGTHNKGIQLDRVDPSHVFDQIIELDDPNWNKWIEKIWAKIQGPSITIPTERQLEDFARKAEEDADGGTRRRSRGGRDRDEDDRGRGRDDRGRGGRDRDRDRDDDDRGFRGRSRDRSDDRGDDRGRDEGPRGHRSTGEDNDGQEPQTSRRSSREQETPREERSERREQPAPDAGDPSEAREQREERPSTPTRRSNPAIVDQPQDKDGGGGEPPREERAAAPPRRTQSRETETNEQPAAPLRGQPTQSPTRRQEGGNGANAGDDGDLGPQTRVESSQQPPTRRGQEPQGVDEAEDNVAEEKRDPAPPVKERVTEEPPPPVSTKAPAPKRGGSSNAELQERLARLNSRQA